MKDKRKLMIHGLGAEGLTFTNCTDITINTREITFKGEFGNIPVEVNKLKPSGLLILDITNDHNRIDYPKPAGTVVPDAPAGTVVPVGAVVPVVPVGTVIPNPVPTGTVVPGAPTVKHTRQELYDLGTAAFQKGINIMELVPSIYDGQLQNVPDAEIDNLYKVFDDAVATAGAK